MSSFRRSQLRGSEELFRPTELRTAAVVAELVAAPPRNSTEPGPQTRPEGHLIRLSDDEIAVLSDALQHLKFPSSTRPTGKPSIAEFERLEELRQKLLAKR